MSISIKIGEKWVITSDQHQFILNQIFVRGSEAKNPGEEYMVAVAYYPTIKSLVSGLLNRELKASDSKTLNELLVCVESASAACQAAFNGCAK